MPICYIECRGEGGLEIVITEWALQSYLDLLAAHAFTKEEYRTRIRPMVMMLKQWPNLPTELERDKAWSPATIDGRQLANCYKMKWHNLNDRKTKQMRLGVVILEEVAYLCRAYTNKDTEHLEMLRLKAHAEKIGKGKFEWRGLL